MPVRLILQPALLGAALAALSSAGFARPSAPVTGDHHTAADYALATCLTQRATGALRDEGYDLGSITISNLGRSALDFGAVREAVRRELARRPMTTVHIDAPVDRSDRPALIAHCLEISRSAEVRAALDRLARKRR